MSNAPSTPAPVPATATAPRIGIGLPAAVPGTPATTIGPWAAASERRGFASLTVFDRLVYDNLDPLTALAAAATRTERTELLTTVLNVGYRRNAVVLAKQLASVDRLADGRLTPGLALGGWPEDYAASDAPLTGRGRLFDETIATLRRVWAGELTGASGPIGPTPGRPRPRLLLGGLVPASYARVAALADGWIAPSFGLAPLTEGIAGVRRAWREAARPGRPRIVAERYFCLGPGAAETADHYLTHYYGPAYFPHVRADTLTTPTALHDELARLADAGCDDVLLLPCAGGLDQVDRLADALTPTAHRTGVLP
jgi:alkanesulfonate monooxygenase SsuD/methylene tetrahydromethanopterin reductase-like flavin-dependent oxidoreductase (luciferase family)